MPHDHNEGECPLCPSPERLAEMRRRNLEAAALKRDKLLQEIKANPSAFVFLIEGSEDADDRCATVMHLASTLELARRYIAEEIGRSRGIFEIIPYRVDGTDSKNGTVVLLHSRMVDDERVEGPGRFLKDSA